MNDIARDKRRFIRRRTVFRHCEGEARGNPRCFFLDCFVTPFLLMTSCVSVIARLRGNPCTLLWIDFGLPPPCRA
jgi:hypothetical protein